jgi:hypothetical protein
MLELKLEAVWGGGNTMWLDGDNLFMKFRPMTRSRPSPSSTTS